MTEEDPAYISFLLENARELWSNTHSCPRQQDTVTHQPGPDLSPRERPVQVGKNGRKTSTRVIRNRLHMVGCDTGGSGYPCDNCGQECKKDARHADMVCPDCGTCHPDAISNQAIHSMSYDEYGMFKSSVDAHDRKNCYKRVNYFKELLKNLTDTRGDNVPGVLVERLRHEIEDWRRRGGVTSVREIRQILKKKKLGKFYPQTQALQRHISGKSSTVSLSHNETEILTSLFSRTSIVFDKLGVNRKNGLNYSYTMAQLLRVIGRDDCCRNVNVLKCKKRLKTHDAIWKEICECLSIPFFPFSDKVV